MRSQLAVACVRLATPIVLILLLATNALAITVSQGGLVVADSQEDSGFRRQVDVTAALQEEDIESFDELSLEELLDLEIISATQTKQRISEAPAIMTVVRGDELRRSSSRSVADALRRVVGVYVIDNHIQPDVGLRGFFAGLRAPNGMLKVMIDGRSVAFRSTSTNWLGPELIPLTAVERIEVIRGPASAVYGADAFVGVVNIITRAGAELDGAQLLLEGTRHLGRPGARYELSVGGENALFDFVFSAALHAEDRSGLALPDSSPGPQVPTWKDNRSQAKGLTGFSGSALLKCGYDVSDATRIAVYGYAAAMDRGAEFADWSVLSHGIDASGRLSDNRVSLAHGHAGAELRTTGPYDSTLSIRGSYFVGGPTERDRIEVGNSLFYIRRRFGYQGFEFDGRAVLDLGNTLRAVSSVELIADREDLPSVLHVLKSRMGGQEPGSVREATSIRQGTKWLLNPGGYIQLVWQANRNISLTGGLRYDHHTVYGSQLSGRAGVTASATGELHAKLLYGRAFRAPSPQLLYGVPFGVGDVMGSADLKPQYIDVAEGQLLWNVAPGISASVGLVYSVLRNKAEFVPRGVNQVAHNVSEQRGITAEVEINVSKGGVCSGYLNAAWQATRRSIDDIGYAAELLRGQAGVFPELVVNAGARYTLPFVALDVGADVSYASSRPASDSNALMADERYEFAPLLLLGAALSTSALPLLRDRQTRLSVAATNLLDKKAVDPGYGGVDYPGSRRTIMLRWYQQF